MSTYVALLRGINVGGKNVIRMTALAACFEEIGLSDVTTYIQSGNVVFSAKAAAAPLERKIAKALSDAFGYAATLVLRSEKEMSEIVAKAPKGFGKDPDRFRYDVLFLMAPLTAAEAIRALAPKEGVDTAHAGKGVVYVSRLIAKATQSRLPR